MNYFVEDQHEKWRNYIYRKPIKGKLIGYLMSLMTGKESVKFVLLENGTLFSYDSNHFDLGSSLEQHLRNCLDKCQGKGSNYNDMTCLIENEEFAVVEHGLKEWGLTVIFD